MFIVRNSQGKMSSSFFVLFMNLILNFVYGNLISVLIKIGGESNFILAKYTLIGYIILCFVSIILQCYGKRSYFDVIYNLCRELNISKKFFDTIKYNRTVPPLILVSAYAQHQESREVWEEYKSYEVPIYNEYHYTDLNGITIHPKIFSHIETSYKYRKTHYSKWDRVDQGGGRFLHTPGHSNSNYKKSIEYKTVETWSKKIYYEYGSWEDETQNLYNIQYAAIIKAKFYKDIILDEEAFAKLNELKDEIYNEGLKHDTKVFIDHELQSPEMNDKITSVLNEDDYNRIQNKFSNLLGYFFWFIFFIFGYSSIYESFARYQIVKEEFFIKKRVSDDHNLRAKYNEFDENEFLLNVMKFKKKTSG